jgi:hypothetical protein
MNFGVVEYWLSLPEPGTDTFKNKVQPGDMLLITYGLTDISKNKLTFEMYKTYVDNWTNIPEQDKLSENQFSSYKNGPEAIWNSWVKNWYTINNNYTGQYIVVRGNLNNFEDELIIQKLTSVDLSIKSICGISPDSADGNVRLQLKDIYISDYGDIVGKQKTDYIMTINEKETPGIYNKSEKSLPHFTINDVAYARFDELSEFWNEFNESYNYLSGKLSSVIDHAIKTDNFLSGTLGKSDSNNIASGDYQTIISEPIFDQLRRIYNDMTLNTNKLENTTNKVDFLHTNLNKQAAGIHWVDFEWKTRTKP